MSAEFKRGDLALVRAAAVEPQPIAAEDLGAAEIAFVEAWARATPYNPYRNYPLVSKPQAAQVLAAAVLEAGPQVTRLWHREGATPTGLIRVEALPWDSALYGRRMGRITHVCGDLDARAVRALLEHSPFDHLAARIDASNAAAQRALTEAGFFPVDSVLKFLHDPARGPPPEPAARRSRARQTFRKYEPRDRDDVLRLTAETFARYPGRYYADPWLRPLGAERYVRWAEKYADGEADTIWVSESRGRVVAYLAFRYNRVLLRVLGLGCYGAGLGASRGGDYQALCRHALMFTTDIAWQVAEFDTQIDNYHVHRIYRDLKFDYALAEHTYHFHRA
jgi:hypothetical protein